MERVAEVGVWIDFAVGAAVTFCDPLELSLDCFVCRRCDRTVIFREGQPDGKCTPTGHPFPGRIAGKETNQTGSMRSVVYRVRYRYETFTDTKYPDRNEPTWVRVNFEVSCPSCGQATKANTQTNLRRPRESRCKCGCVLFTERDGQPSLSSANAAPDTEPPECV